MTIPVHRPKRADVEKCVARFKDIRPISGGLPDMPLEDCRRNFYNVLGFAQPDSDGEVFSPIGDEAKPKISHLAAGFGMAYVEAEPGKGVLMHTHDTNETFVVVEGAWKFEWEGENGNEHVVCEEKDVVSFPVGIQRRFECVSARPGKSTGMIMAVVGGDRPGVEWSPEAVARMKEAGTWPAEAAA